jgi:hypothetical protein
MEEPAEVVPTVEVLCASTESTYTSTAIVQMEALLLNKLGWDLAVVTPEHFLGIFATHCITETDLINHLEILNVPGIRKDVSSTAEFFVTLARQGKLKYRHFNVNL